MKCDKCKSNEATYFMEQNINGHITKIALCPECAKIYGDTPFKHFAGFDLLEGLFGVPGHTHSATKEIKRCTLCGSSFNDIINTGKVGCAKCYEVFEKELRPTILRLHGDVKHIGRTPKNVCAPKAGESVSSKKENTAESKNPESQILSLKAQISDAIKSEEYELAAQLRDKIRDIEKQEVENHNRTEAHEND